MPKSTDEDRYELLEELGKAVFDLMDNSCEDHTLDVETVYTIEKFDRDRVCDLLDKLYGVI